MAEYVCFVLNHFVRYQKQGDVATWSFIWSGPLYKYKRVVLCLPAYTRVARALPDPCELFNSFSCRSHLTIDIL